jgi:pimeloyl-ACP methyl ester carboxylesterase
MCVCVAYKAVIYQNDPFSILFRSPFFFLVTMLFLFSFYTGENHHDWRDEMSYHEMAYDVVKFLDDQKMDSAVLVGHSMGGKVAQALALLEPERVSGLVVMDIAPVRYQEDEPHWKAVKDIVQVLASVQVGPGVTRQQIDQQLRSSIPDPALRAFCLTNLNSKCEWKIHLEAIAARLDQLAGFDIDVSRTYEGDAFFIHGGQSRFVRHSYLPSITNYFPNHLLTTIRGAGHWIHAEAPDDTTQLLKRFLDR